MGNLNLILFISIAAPVAMTLGIYQGKSRTLLMFLLIGLATCLLCGEINGLIAGCFPLTMRYLTTNLTPVVEEVIKALPILFYAFLYQPRRQTLLECSMAVGVGFAVLENAYILAGNANAVSVLLAVFRGFGAGMMHALCTLAVGFGMSFINTKRKLFYTGTVALLSVAIVFHSIYNSIVQTPYSALGILLPLSIFIALRRPLLHNRAEES